jgi:plastocyanin
MRIRRVRTRGAIATAGLVLGAWLAVAAGAAHAADGAVRISGFAFSPDSVTVGVGESVTWTNEDAVAHTATGSGGAFDTERLDPGESTTITFATAGSYAYVCAIHPTMTGTVVVEPGSASGGAALTPAPTDTYEPAWAGSRDPLGLAAVLLAVAGLAMLGATAAWDRRRMD